MKLFILSISLLCTVTHGQAVDFIRHDKALVIRYIIEYYSGLSDAEFQQLESQVQGKPEHPSRARYEKERALRSNGPEIVEYLICVDDGRIIRFNMSNTHDELYADIGRDGSALWQMSRQQLAIVPLEGELPHGAPNMKSRLEQVSREFGYLWSKARTMNEAMRAGDWEASSNGVSVTRSKRLSLRRSVTDGGPVEVTIIASETYPDLVGTRWRFSGSSLKLPLNDTIPTRMEKYSPEDRLVRALEIVDVSEIDTKTALSYGKIPSIDSHDDFRGETTFTGIYDYRTADPEITVRGADGLVTVLQSETPAAHRKRWLRYLGWGTAAILVAAIFLARAGSKWKGS